MLNPHGERIGMSIKTHIGLGDAIQFTSVPENFYRTFGKRLVDVSGSWVLKYNPFVDRGIELPPGHITEMWDYQRPQPKPPERPLCYLSMAERHAWVFKAKVFTKYPRLYIYEDFPLHKREKIFIQIQGKSHGRLPDHVIDHVLKKYKGFPLIQLDTKDVEDIGLPRVYTPDVWDLVKEISECKMLIGPDSGPSWIAACYPDVICKKVRMSPTPEHFQNWLPLEIQNIHSHWDDRFALICNPTEDDIGFTASYRRI